MKLGMISKLKNLRKRKNIPIQQLGTIGLSFSALTMDEMDITTEYEPEGAPIVIKSVIGRIRSNFNVSAAETGANSMHQRAEVGFALVGNDPGLINSKMDRIINLVEAMGVCGIMDSEMEIMHL